VSEPACGFSRTTFLAFCAKRCLELVPLRFSLQLRSENGSCRQFRMARGVKIAHLFWTHGRRWIREQHAVEFEFSWKRGYVHSLFLFLLCCLSVCSRGGGGHPNHSCRDRERRCHPFSPEPNRTK
jgi:hypothetical protein